MVLTPRNQVIYLTHFAKEIRLGTRVACVAGGIVCEGKILTAENGVSKLLLPIPFAAPPLELRANKQASTRVQLDDSRYFIVQITILAVF